MSQDLRDRLVAMRAMVAEGAMTTMGRGHCTTLINDTLAALEAAAPAPSEPGQLDPLMAVSQARTMLAFAHAFDGEKFEDWDATKEFDRRHLGIALDHLEIAASMILNLADRVKPAHAAAIPDDEPVFMLRASDKHAVGLLGDYHQQCNDPAQFAAVEAAFIQFGEWADAHPERMREPTIAMYAPAALAVAAPSVPVEQDRIFAALDANNKVVREFIDDYEFDDGESCARMPTEGESELIADAIHGLLSDDEFVATYNAWQDLVRSKRAALASAPAEKQEQA